jgi:hypothetical protein
MKNKIFFIFISLFLLICISSMPLMGMKISLKDNTEIPSTIFDENDAEAPVWDVGHSWTYDVNIFGGIPNYVSLNVRMSNLKFKVDEVHNDTYKISFSSSITGSVTVKLEIIKISGQFQNTDMSGVLIVNKSKFTINETKNLIIDGFIKPNLLPKIPFNIAGDCLFTYEGNPLFKFPINNYESWVVHETLIGLNFTVSLLPDPVQGNIYVEGHIVECLEWDIVNVQAGEFDALKLSSYLGDEHHVWYSVAAGNVVKMIGRDIPFNWGYAGEYYIDLQLKSTNFHIDSNSPSVPTSLSGPSEVVAGYSEYFFAGGSTDPDGDMIRYIFDWGDGKKTGTDFVESGQNVSIEKYWTKKGVYNVKVKARDKYGAQSDWSDPITVRVLNDPPLKPEPPNGPMHGYWRETHTYTATTTDPDNHRVRFRFDWGDRKTSTTNLVYSGETASSSHRWRWPKSYQIKVKAIDEYGEESPWSDSIEVSIPRSRTSNRPFFNFIGRFSRLFLILQNIIK